MVLFFSLPTVSFSLIVSTRLRHCHFDIGFPNFLLSCLFIQWWPELASENFFHFLSSEKRYGEASEELVEGFQTQQWQENEHGARLWRVCNYNRAAYKRGM